MAAPVGESGPLKRPARPVILFRATTANIAQILIYSNENRINALFFSPKTPEIVTPVKLRYSTASPVNLKAQKKMAIPQKTIEVDPIQELISAFSVAVGEGDSGAVKLYKQSREGRREYIGKVPVPDNNFEFFIDDLREKYPEGGQFYLTLINQDGKSLGNKAITLTNLRPSVPALRNENTSRQDNNLLTTLMQTQSQSSRENMQMMIAMMTSQQQSLMTMMGLIIPAMTGNKESASDLLSKMVDIQGKIAPKPETGGIKDTLEMMKTIREVMGEPSEPADGFAGMIQAATPLLAAVAAGMNNQAQQQPQAQPQAVRAVNPALQPTAPGQQHQGAAQPAHNGQAGPIDQALQMQMFFIEKYRPLMAGIKQLILNEYEPNALAGYVEMKVASGEISEDEAKVLYSALEQADEQNLSAILQLFDITDPQHVAEVREAIALLTGKLDQDDESGGPGGDVPSTGPHGEAIN